MSVPSGVSNELRSAIDAGVAIEDMLFRRYGGRATRYGFLWEPRERMPVDIYDMSTLKPLGDIKYQHAFGRFVANEAQMKNGVFFVFYRVADEETHRLREDVLGLNVVFQRFIDSVEKRRIKDFLKNVLAVKVARKLIKATKI